jgi:hypothetical protein
MKSAFVARFDDALAKVAGPGRPISYKQVAVAGGVCRDTLRRYRTGESRIPAEIMVKLFKLLGPDFRAEVLGDLEAPDPSAIGTTPRQRGPMESRPLQTTPQS